MDSQQLPTSHDSTLPLVFLILCSSFLSLFYAWTSRFTFGLELILETSQLRVFLRYLQTRPLCWQMLLQDCLLLWEFSPVFTFHCTPSGALNENGDSDFLFRLVRYQHIHSSYYLFFYLPSLLNYPYLFLILWLGAILLWMQLNSDEKLFHSPQRILYFRIFWR